MSDPHDKTDPCKQFLQLPYPLLSRMDLSLPAKVVFAFLRSYKISGCEQIYPEQSTIVRATGIDRATVQRGIYELEHKGFITVDRHNGGVNYYHIVESQTGWAAPVANVTAPALELTAPNEAVPTPDRATPQNEHVAPIPDQATTIEPVAQPQEQAVPPIKPTAPITPPASPQSKTKKGPKNPTGQMTDEMKTRITKTPRSMRIWLSYGQNCLDMKNEELILQPREQMHWYTQSNDPRKPDPVLSDMSAAGFYWALLSRARVTSNLPITFPNVGKLVKIIHNLRRGLTRDQLVSHMERVTNRWPEIKAPLSKFGESLALDESTLAIPQVIAQSDKLAAGQSIAPVNKLQTGAAVGPSLPGMDLTPDQSDMACRDLAHMHIYLLWGPSAVIPEVMNLATHREMMSAAVARGLKPGATMLYNPINAATSAGWTDPQWASYYWTIISALRADRGKALTPPDWRKLMSNIKTLRSKYGSRLWNFLETFDDNYDEIMPDPDDKNFVIALNESTLNHGTIAAKLEQMVDDQPADAGSSADWSNHPGNAYLAAVSAPSLAQLQATEAAKHNPPPTPPAPPSAPAPVAASMVEAIPASLSSLITPAPCPTPVPSPPYSSFDFSSNVPIPAENPSAAPEPLPLAVRLEPVNFGAGQPTEEEYGDDADQPAQEYDFSVDQPIEEYDDRADQPVEECVVCA